MVETDLSQVMDIEINSFAAPWSLDSFLREIKDNPYALYLTAYTGKRLVGYIGGWLIINKLHITNLAVNLDFRRQGVANKLITKLINSSKEKGVSQAILEVRVSNKAAINLYKKNGFVLVGYRSHYYSNNNEDALIMWKEYDDE